MNLRDFYLLSCLKSNHLHILFLRYFFYLGINEKYVFSLKIIIKPMTSKVCAPKLQKFITLILGYLCVFFCISVVVSKHSIITLFIASQCKKMINVLAYLFYNLKFFLKIITI